MSRKKPLKKKVFIRKGGTSTSQAPAKRSPGKGKSKKATAKKPAVK